MSEAKTHHAITQRARKALFRISLWVVVAVVVPPAVLLLVIFGSIVWGEWESIGFAREKFAKLDTSINRVIASNRYTDLLSTAAVCVNAIVELKPEATTALASDQSALDTATGWEQYYGSWQATPMKETKDLFTLRGVSGDGVKLAGKGLREAGGWYFQKRDQTTYFLPRYNILGYNRCER